jgi:glycosyltransferase involved in cell wall biosynthesis
MTRITSVSVVVNNYNYAKYVNAAIRSVLTQDYQHKQLIVVDDGSTDMSWSIIEKYRDSVEIHRQHNGGQGSACNTGYAKAEGDWVIFLDADDVLLPGALAEVAKHEPDVASNLTWRMRAIDSEGTESDRLIPPTFKLLGSVALLAEHGPYSFTYAPTSGNAWPRRFLNKVMPCPQDYFPDTVDGYLAHCAPFYGETFVIPQNLSAYRLHGENMYGTKSEFQKRDLIRKRYQYLCQIVESNLRLNDIKFDKRNWSYSYWTDLDAFEKWIKSFVPPKKPFVLVDDDRLRVGSELFGRPRYELIDSDYSVNERAIKDNDLIVALDEFGRSGVHYVVFIKYSFYWLDEYPSFRRHLENKACRIHENDYIRAYYYI